jgi:NitT/TauT family transport system substrate-binding protein
MDTAHTQQPVVRPILAAMRPAVGVVLLVALSGCGSGPKPKTPLTIGVPREPLGALMAVAAGQDFFSQEGLDVTLVSTYPSGKRALAGMLDGEVELTAASEVPIVFRSMQQGDFRIIATIGTSDNEPKIVARADLGIQQPADLAGRRIGTQQASAVHYYLHLFLLRHALSDKVRDIVFMKAEQLPTALASGDIDAFSMREPFVGEAEQLLGEKAIVFSEPGVYVKTFNLVVREDVLQQKPEAVRAVLRALVRAEEFVREHPLEARQTTGEQLDMDEAGLQAAWPQINLRVLLGQDLLTLMEDEADWAIDCGFVDAAEAPNYLEFIELEPLNQVCPDCVTVVH